MYGSQNLAKSEQAVISAVGDGRIAGLQITAINGKAVDRLKTVSFLVPAGTYKFSIHANKDLKIVRTWEGMGITKKEADLTIQVVVQPGHTYIPIAEVQGDMIEVMLEDKGLNFPSECLPLYLIINGSSNPGHKLYQTDIKCKI